MTSGGARDVWPGVGSNIVFAFLSDTVRPAASKTVTMTVIILASSSAGLETMPASSAYSIPHTALRTQAVGTSFPTATYTLLEVDQIPNDFFVLTEAYQNDVYHSSEEHVEQQLRQHAALSQSLRDIEPFRMLAVIRTYASPHTVVLLAENY